MRDHSYLIADSDRAVRAADNVIAQTRASIEQIYESIDQTCHGIDATKQRLRDAPVVAAR